MEKTGDLIGKRRKKIENLKNKKIDLFPNDFNVVHTVRDITNALERVPDSSTDQNFVFVVAGRMMAINRFGKASFIRFRDRTGRLQAYIRKDKIGDKAYGLFKQLDIGDFIGLKGSMFKTKTGECTEVLKPVAASLSAP